MTIGGRINLLRYEKDLTIEKLAQMANISKNTLVSWLYHDIHPDPLALTAVADVLGVSLDYLAGRTDIREMNNTKGEPVRACSWCGQLPRN